MRDHISATRRSVPLVRSGPDSVSVPGRPGARFSQKAQREPWTGQERPGGLRAKAGAGGGGSPCPAAFHGPAWGDAPDGTDSPAPRRWPDGAMGGAGPGGACCGKKAKAGSRAYGGPLGSRLPGPRSSPARGQVHGAGSGLWRQGDHRRRRVPPRKAPGSAP